MTNHVHLLVTPMVDSSISQMMQALGRRYVYYINKTYKRTGLFGKADINPACLTVINIY